MRRQQIVKILTVIAVSGFGFLVQFQAASPITLNTATLAKTLPTPTPSPAAEEFSQAAALAKLREQIKGKGKDPASAVFKNLQTPLLKNVPAGQLLAIMEMGYSRSLGVNCTHCHVADKWDSDEKPQKQITRDMAAMAAKINGELLKNIKNLSTTPTVNCTTCHRGQIVPATNLQQPPKS